MISENIRTLCRQHNIPVYKLERHLGIANGSVNRWKTCSPNIKTVKMVADYFGVTVDELLSGPSMKGGEAVCSETAQKTST